MTSVDAASSAEKAIALTIVDGLKAAIPVVIAYVPIGFSFGIAATSAGFSAADSVLMSLVMYSGAAQFMAVALLTAGAPLVVAALTLIAMNLRHLLYGPALMKAAGNASPMGNVWWWGFWLTDEVFGAALGRLSLDKRRFTEPFIIGLGLASYLAWSGGTLLGGIAGSGALADYPVLHQSLIFMYPAMFLSFLLSILSRRQAGSVSAAVAATIAGTFAMSAATGILGGMLAGAAWGTVSGGIDKRSNAE